MIEMSPTELLKMSSAELTFNDTVSVAKQVFVILCHKHSCFYFNFHFALHYKD